MKIIENQWKSIENIRKSMKSIRKLMKTMEINGNNGNQWQQKKFRAISLESGVKMKSLGQVSLESGVKV